MPYRGSVSRGVSRSRFSYSRCIVGYLADLFGKLNLINTHFALILPYIAWTVPLALWINMSYFTQIPLDLDKAALVDGASRTKTLVRIILPIALPGIFSSFLLVFIACFNECGWM